VCCRDRNSRSILRDAQPGALSRWSCRGAGGVATSSQWLYNRDRDRKRERSQSRGMTKAALKPCDRAGSYSFATPAFAKGTVTTTVYPTPCAVCFVCMDQNMSEAVASLPPRSNTTKLRSFFSESEQKTSHFGLVWSCSDDVIGPADRPRPHPTSPTPLPLLQKVSKCLK
jgi:hypothetical protein